MKKTPQSVCPRSFWHHWMAEIIRLREVHWGPLADHEANRLARRQSSPDSALFERARLLARQHAFEPAMQRYHTTLGITRWVVLLLMIISGITLAIGLTPQSHNIISVADMLIGLLAVNCVFILLWLIMTLLRPSTSGLGHTLLTLIQRRFFSSDQITVVQAHTSLARQQGLLQPALGSVTHAAWLVMLICALLTLTWRFIGYDYQFIWRTTLLSEADLARLVSWLHLVPGWLGLQEPQISMQQSMQQSASHDAQRTTALWLLSCLIIYAIVPRLILFAICYARYSYKLRHLSIDWSLPGFAELKARLRDSPQHAPATEREQVIEVIPQRKVSTKQMTSDGAAWLYLEGQEGLLPDGADPARLNAVAAFYGYLDSRQQRDAVLDTLLSQPPRRLLVIINPDLSADRGSLRLLAQFTYYTTVGIFIRQDLDTPRANHWREQITEHLDAALLTTTDHAMQWLHASASESVSNTGRANGD